MPKLLVGFLIFLFLPAIAFAHQPRLIFFQKDSSVQVANPELSQAFYDELKGQPKDYFIEFPATGELYLNLLVPEIANPNGRYSANVFKISGAQEEKLAVLDGNSVQWQTMWEEFGRDYYLKGPEFDQKVPAGKYKVEVFSTDNQGKYVLAVGKVESFDIPSTLNVYWQIPLLKLSFFKTDILQFFLTPFGIGLIAAIGVLLILLAIIYWIVGLIRQAIKHAQAKTLLLTSAGMEMKKEIIKLLQKPAYDITLAFITTAAKPEADLGYVKKDWDIMKEIGFNVEEIDIEGKKESQVFEILKLKDIIFVEGGDTSYLLKAMRACHFEKTIRKLLKEGKVYIGASAGSIVAGKMGLNLVPFDIFVHYTPDCDQEIIQKMKNPKKRAKKLRIITDQQAILVQGKEVSLIGEGEAIVV